VQRIGNLFTEGSFATDEQIRNMKIEKYENLLNNPVMMAGMGEVEETGWHLAGKRAEEMDRILNDLGVTPEEAEWLMYKRAMEREGITVNEVAKIDVSGYKLETLPENLRINTNAVKLIASLADQHNIDPELMRDILLQTNGAETIADLQQMIKNGETLQTFAGLGWEKGMQQKYYGDYDRMIAMRNAGFKECSELPTIQNDEYDVIIKELKKENEKLANVIKKYESISGLEDFVNNILKFGDASEKILAWAAEEENDLLKALKAIPAVFASRFTMVYDVY